MARLGEIELLDHGLCGGAFLSKRPFSVGLERNSADVLVQARKGTRWLVVKSTNAVALPDLLPSMLGEAQLALDLMGRRGYFVELDAVHTDHLLWWDDGSGPRLRAVHLTLFDAPKMNAQLSVKRADGTPAPPPPSLPWHPLLRFYRLAHLSEDPIERFRYLYLGIENAMDVLPKN